MKYFTSVYFTMCYILEFYPFRNTSKINWTTGTSGWKCLIKCLTHLPHQKKKSTETKLVLTIRKKLQIWKGKTLEWTLWCWIRTRSTIAKSFYIYRNIDVNVNVHVCAHKNIPYLYMLRRPGAATPQEQWAQEVPQSWLLSTIFH